MVVFFSLFQLKLRTLIPMAGKEIPTYVLDLGMYSTYRPTYLSNGGGGSKCPNHTRRFRSRSQKSSESQVRLSG